MKSDPLITYRRKPATLDSTSLETFAETLRVRVARGRDFHCRITNDAELEALNRKFRKQDYATDVLTFPGECDIAISIDRARVQAREWKHSLEDEIRILMLHAVLHLQGMDHETDNGQMKRREQSWRRKLGLPNALVARAAQTVKQ